MTLWLSTPLSIAFMRAAAGKILICVRCRSSTAIPARKKAEKAKEYLQKEHNAYPFENEHYIYSMRICFLEDDFEKANSITLLPSQLREIVASGKPLDLIANEKSLNTLTQNLEDLAYTSLIKRGMGEEVLL